MELHPEDLSVDTSYKLLTGAVVPRFIAWVATRSAAGVSNLAPFSYATIAGHAPVSLLFVVAGQKPNTEPKDTLRNVRPVADGGSGAFVVHVVDEALAPAMARSAATLGYEESEIENLGLAAVPASRVAAPRLLEAKVAFECQTSQIVAVGTASIVIGEVKAIHLRDGLVDERSRIAPEALAAVGRMAGSHYLRTRDVFEIKLQ